MRRLLALSALFLLLAGAAGAQSTSQAQTPSLRGSQSAASATGPTSGRQTADGQAAPNDIVAPASGNAPVSLSGGLAALAPAPLMSPVPAASLGDGAQQCRTACAKSHYFCIAAGDDLEECASAWAQCAARCNRPPV